MSVLANPTTKKKIHAMLRGNFWPVEEVDDTKEEVAFPVRFGTVPEGLEGHYVRNGPNNSFDLRAGQAYHLFDGDGMLHQISLRDGRATGYRRRRVRTERYLKNQEAGSAIHPIGESMRGNMAPMMDVLYPPSAGVALMRGTANTAVVYHAGKLLALHEGDQPYELETRSLETKGRLTWEGKLQHRFTAHPKVCPHTGEMIFFGANATEPDCWMHYSVLDAAGNLKISNAPVHGLRAPIVMHDIAITRKFSIVLDLPLFILNNPKLGQGPYFHDTEAPARFGVIPRHFEGGVEASKTIRWFEASSCFVYHMANAWESNDGKYIHMVGCRSPHMDLGGLGSSVWRLHSWRLNLETGHVDEKEISGEQVEFPVVAPWRVGQRTRFVYAVRFQPHSPASFNAVLKFDLETGEETVHNLPEGINSSEFVLASSKSRTAADSDSDSDEYLLTYTHDTTGSQAEVMSRNSSLYLVNVNDMSCQAEIPLPSRVPFGFHGTFYSTSEKQQPTSRL